MSSIPETARGAEFPLTPAEHTAKAARLLNVISSRTTPDTPLLELAVIALAHGIAALAASVAALLAGEMALDWWLDLAWPARLFTNPFRIPSSCSKFANIVVFSFSFWLITVCPRWPPTR